MGIPKKPVFYNLSPLPVRQVPHFSIPIAIRSEWYAQFLEVPVWYTLFIILLVGSDLLGQVADSTQHANKKRLQTFAIASGATYSVALVGLNELWYKESGKQSFHFFNDNAEWNQVDKFGHFYSAFYLSYGTSKAISWCGLQQRKADALGSLTGFLILLPIEILDGVSTAYGASTGDLVANAAGACFFLLQSTWWKEIRIRPKFSFHQTNYAPLRPNLLGDNFTSELLKDYNGQTYWLSFDMDKFIKFPKWLNLTTGYGAHGMVYAREAPNTEAGYDSYRQYYLGLDFDLTAIKTRSKTLKIIFTIVSMIKLPAPAIEFSSKGTRFHAFYF